MLVMKGVANGRQITLRWSNGELSGDDYAVEQITEICKLYEGHEVSVGFTKGVAANHIFSMGSVWELAKAHLFDRLESVTGLEELGDIGPSESGDEIA